MKDLFKILKLILGKAIVGIIEEYVIKYPILYTSVLIRDKLRDFSKGKEKKMFILPVEVIYNFLVFELGFTVDDIDVATVTHKINNVLWDMYLLIKPHSIRLLFDDEAPEYDEYYTLLNKDIWDMLSQRYKDAGYKQNPLETSLFINVD